MPPPGPSRATRFLATPSGNSSPPRSAKPAAGPSARKLAAETDLGVFERTYTRPDATVLILEIHEHYRRAPNGRILGIRSFLLDITARKQAEDALRKVQEDLESRIRERTQELELAIDFLRREMDEKRLAEKEHRKLEAQVQYSQRLESMGILAGGVAHKFNNLLTSMMGYTTLAVRELPVESRARDHLDQVLSAADERRRPDAAVAGLRGPRPVRSRGPGHLATGGGDRTPSGSRDFQEGRHHPGPLTAGCRASRPMPARSARS